MFMNYEYNKNKFKFNNYILIYFYRCLKKYLTPISIEKPNIMEMCGRICSILTLFVPVSNYNFENLLNSLNVIYERINTNLGKLNMFIKM